MVQERRRVLGYGYCSTCVLFWQVGFLGAKPPRREARRRLVCVGGVGLVGDGDFADGGDGGGAAFKAGEEETLERHPIVCFDDEIEDVFGVGAVASNEFYAGGVWVKE